MSLSCFCTWYVLFALTEGYLNALLCVIGVYNGNNLCSVDRNLFEVPLLDLVCWAFFLRGVICGAMNFYCSALTI